ncbi:hypothetical protein [Streptomyces lancefieldiae]|uniref:Secreted protein n=1 Tax=Streptomyces lancefieldiae TaxID=3075520 RepID=A0ABU3B259_9ACTN|nr:hypothetical protein [Streptomyces sp. DSM 40712]MDT0616521.1 hypothetical protein [Streptomyces sp. DSM 40712]
MRIRRALAVAAVAAALSTGVSASPAAAAQSNPSPGEVSAAAWYKTTSLGGPIRKCYAATCDQVIWADAGRTMEWSHNAYNASGNRWYYVHYVDGNGTPYDFYGWIYCGNVTAPC